MSKVIENFILNLEKIEVGSKIFLTEGFFLVVQIDNPKLIGLLPMSNVEATEQNTINLFFSSIFSLKFYLKGLDEKMYIAIEA